MLINNSSLWRNITKDDRRWLVRVLDVSNKAYDYIRALKPIPKESFECHSICRALGRIVPELVVKDGWFVGGELKREGAKITLVPKFAEHSWLLTPDGAILDPYPVGVIAINVLLVPTRGTYKNYGSVLYLEDSAVTKKVETPLLDAKVKLLSGWIAKASNITQITSEKLSTSK